MRRRSGKRFEKVGIEIKQEEDSMTVENGVRIVAGAIILLSLALGVWVSHYWLFLTAFVGANLIQSAFTHFCPAEMILRKLGLK